MSRRKDFETSYGIQANHLEDLVAELYQWTQEGHHYILWHPFPESDEHKVIGQICFDKDGSPILKIDPLFLHEGKPMNVATKALARERARRR
jgi:hypothetical protein